MNSDRSHDHADVWSELPPALRAAAQAVHAAKPSPSDMDSFLTRLAQRPPESRSGPESPCAIAPQPPARAGHSPRNRLWSIGAGLVAGAACLWAALFLLPSSAASALDEVTRALGGRACVKMSTTDADGSTSEHWYFPGKNISAWRNDQWIEYRDHETQITYSYDRGERKLYRTADAFGPRNDFLVKLVESLSSLANRQADKQIKGMEITATRVRTVERDGKQHKELEVSLRTPQAAEPVLATIVVGPSDSLPEIVRLSGRQEGRELRVVSRFDYPDAGPADVFDLGAPRDAELVDRIPATDVKRLVAGVYAGRLRFDDYRAIVFRMSNPEIPVYDARSVMLIAKKGTRTVYLRTALSLPSELAAKPRDELAKQLLANHDQVRWYPVAVTDGQTRHWFDVRFHDTNRGEQTIEVASVGNYTYKHMAPEEFIVPAWHDYPHLAGRPPLGIGRQDIAAAVASEVDGGPEGCVLLQTRRSGRVPEAPRSADDRTSPFARGGFWIRPDRDFLVMRDDTSFANDNSYQFVLDELAQSPQGHWYPTRARHIAGRAGKNDGEPGVEHYSYHVEFTAKLPDELFDPKRYVGRR